MDLTKIFYCKKLSAIILLLFSLHLTNSSNAQKITILAKDVPLKEIFSTIESQSGHFFICSEEVYKNNTKLSIDVTRMELKEVLNGWLKRLGLLYVMDGKYIIIKKREDEKIDSDLKEGVRGVVVDEKEREMAGVSVFVKGASIGTTTDEKGEFSLKEVDRDKAVLVFSYVGYEKKEMGVREGETVRVKMALEIIESEEVVVSTGYQDIPKERATGSFVKVDNAILNLQTGTNVLKRLDGVTSGLLFDNNKVRGGSGISTNDNINIRGISTINSSMDPLIILDGFIYDGLISNINPNDIDNINVLKDAAATSIWGAKAGNGVIVISTKKGKINQKTQISLNSTFITSPKPDLYSLPQMSSKDYIEVEQYLYRKGFFDGQISQEYLPVTPAVDIFEKKRLGMIDEEDSIKLINELISTDTRYEYLKYIYTRPLTQQYNLGMRGGNSNSAYTLSVSYDDIKSQVRDKDQKLNVLINSIFLPAKWLKTEIELYHTNSKRKTGAPEYGYITPAGRFAPYFRLAGPDGEALPVAIGFNPGYTDTLLGGKLLDWKFYPLNEYKESYTKTQTQDYFVNAGLQSNIFSWLQLNLKGQYQRQTIQSDLISSLESYFTRNMINSFSQIDANTGQIKYIIPKGGIKTVGNDLLESFTGRAQLNIDKQWYKQSINGIIGWEIRNVRNERKRYMSYGFVSDPLIIIPVDFVNSYPHSIYGFDQKISGSPVEVETLNRFVSIYGNFSYNFDRRYTISASVRRDGSNLFGVHTNDKWKPLWSLGGMWNISSESFYKSGILPTLTFRATYGFSGNVDLNMTAIPIGVYTVAQLSNLPQAHIQVLNNPALRWEKSGMLNLALDFTFKNSMISGSLEYYQKRGTDLYGRTLYDYTTWGYTNEITVNSASMRGEGIDVMLNGRIFDGNFKWSSVLLFNFNTNKVTKYSSANPLIYSKINASTLNLPIVGRPLYSIAAFKWGGLDSSGNPQGYVNDKLSSDYAQITSEAIEKGLDGNLVFVGPSSPKYFGSLSNQFSWKQIAITCMISYRFSYFFQKQALSYTRLITSGIGTKDFDRRWRSPGDEKLTSVPAFLPEIFQNSSERDFFYSSSEVNVLKADNVRIQFINLSYNFEDMLKGNKIFKSLQLFINASNLGFIWKANKEGIDPDFPNALSLSKTYTVGARINL